MLTGPPRCGHWAVHTHWALSDCPTRWLGLATPHRGSSGSHSTIWATAGTALPHPLPNHVLAPLERSCRRGRSTSPAVPRRRCNHKGAGATSASPACLGGCPGAPSCTQHSLTLPQAHAPAPRQEGNGQPVPSWAVRGPTGANRARPRPCTRPGGTVLPPPAGAPQCPHCTSLGHRCCSV